MIRRVAMVLGGLAVVLGVGAGRAGAQPFGLYPQPGYGGFGGYGGYGGYPGYGGTAPSPSFAQSQTLSPYLNLALGRNTAVNFFNAVRPAQIANNYFGPTGPYGGGAMMQGFFPNVVDTLDQLDQAGNPNPNETTRMAPTGHPAGFSNTLGYVGPAGPFGALGQRRPSSMSNLGAPNTPGGQLRR